MRAKIDENKYPAVKTFVDFVASLDPDYECDPEELDDDPDAWPCDAEIYKALKNAGVISDYYREDRTDEYTYAYKSLVVWFRTNPSEIPIKEIREMYQKAFEEANKAGINYVEVELDGDYI